MWYLNVANKCNDQKKSSAFISRLTVVKIKVRLLGDGCHRDLLDLGALLGAGGGRTATAAAKLLLLPLVGGSPALLLLDHDVHEVLALQGEASTLHLEELGLGGSLGW